MFGAVDIVMSSATAIPELLIQVFEHLPLIDLISATHVSQQWRALPPKIDSPTRLRLLDLSFGNDSVDAPHPIPLRVRISYVDKVEEKHNVLIPEPYRTILTEWPRSQPPAGMHWPHSVRFFASGFCFCPREMHETLEMCLCAGREVRTTTIKIPKTIFKLVMDENTIPVDEDYSWELFKNPVRLHTDEQNAQTMRFIRAHAVAEFRWQGRWANLEFKVLQLSRYHFHTAVGVSDGTFLMILDGPTRGQIHAWSSSGDDWYDGFEADSFWDWDYTEWVRNIYTMYSNSDDDEDDDADHS
ncbi:hypothetical protein C8R44DRAFT_867582 [Mycena epipterygia]|nr:hypothetical protein C8R44DRAFT_867582 [Mycena epipterygia]